MLFFSFTIIDNLVLLAKKSELDVFSSFPSGRVISLTYFLMEYHNVSHVISCLIMKLDLTFAIKKAFTVPIRD